MATARRLPVLPFLALWIAASGLAFWWLAWLTRPYSVGLSPDSAIYLSVAQHLLQRKGYITYQGEPLTIFPPLYPTLLASLSLVLRIPPIRAALLWHSWLWGTLVVWAFFWLKRVLPWPVAALFAALFFIARPMVFVFRSYWHKQHTCG